MEKPRAVLSRMSLRSQVLFALLAVAVVMTIQFLVLFTTVAGALDSQGRQALSRVADIWAEAINGRLDNLERMEKYFGYQGDTLHYLSGEDALDTFETVLRLDQDLELTRSVVPALLDVVVYRRLPGPPYHRSAIASRGEILDRFVAGDEQGSKVFYSGPFTMEVSLADRQVVLAGMRVFSTDPNRFSRVPLGTVVFLLDAAALVHMTLPGEGAWTSSFEGADGTVYERQGGAAGKERMATESRSFDRLGGVLVVGQEAGARQGALRLAFLAHILVFLVLTVVAVVLIRFVLAGVLSSNRVLEAFAERVQSRGLSELSETIQLTGYSEAVRLGQTLNTLLAHVQKGNQDLLEAQGAMFRLELRNHQAENKLLLSQINPHFFYNTLETIHGLASYHKVPAIQAISRSMEAILRYSLREGDLVTLDRERSIVEAYLEIQKVRFGDRLETDLAYDPRFGSVRLPKTILQPLVENAFIHGIEPLGRPGRLTLRANLAGPSTLQITITDTGVGIPGTTLERLRAALESDFLDTESQGRKSIGLMNVHERLRLNFGTPHGLTLDGAPGRGTTVTLTVPWEDADV